MVLISGVQSAKGKLNFFGSFTQISTGLALLEQLADLLTIDTKGSKKKKHCTGKTRPLR